MQEYSQVLRQVAACSGSVLAAVSVFCNYLLLQSLLQLGFAPGDTTSYFLFHIAALDIMSVVVVLSPASLQFALGRWASGGARLCDSCFTLGNIIHSTRHYNVLAALVNAYAGTSLVHRRAFRLRDGSTAAATLIGTWFMGSLTHMLASSTLEPERHWQGQGSWCLFTPGPFFHRPFFALPLAASLLLAAHISARLWLRSRRRRRRQRRCHRRRFWNAKRVGIWLELQPKEPDLELSESLVILETDRPQFTVRRLQSAEEAASSPCPSPPPFPFPSPPSTSPSICPLPSPSSSCPSITSRASPSATGGNWVRRLSKTDAELLAGALVILVSHGLCYWPILSGSPPLPPWAEIIAFYLVFLVGVIQPIAILFISRVFE